MKTSKLILILLIFVSGGLKAQDPAFSQFYSAPLFLNPAIAGGSDRVTVGMNTSINLNNKLYPYVLSQFSAVLPVRLKGMRNKSKYFKNGYVGGVGLTAVKESTGSQNRIDVSGLSASTAYFTQISMAHYLSFGLQIGFVKKAVNFNTMTWGSQYDTDIGYDSKVMPSLQLNSEKVIIPLANFGLTWYYNNADFTRFVKANFRTFNGFAVSNMNKPNQSFFDDDASQVPMLVKLHGGFSVPLSDNFEIMPNYIIMRQSGKNQINLGAYASYYMGENDRESSKYYQVQLGSWYRFGDSYIVSLGMEMKNIIFGISYDVNTSKFKYYKQGVQKVEISITYKANQPKSVHTRRTSHPLI